MGCPECSRLREEYHSALEIHALALRAAGGTMGENLSVTNPRVGELYEACQAANRRLKEHSEERHPHIRLGK